MPGGSPIDPSSCTPATCPIDEYGLLDYYPSLVGNALYLAIFGALLLPQIYLGLRHRTWGYLIGMTGGIILEIIGYISRILLHNDIYSLSYFVMNICCLTLGPAWFSAAIYVCLSRIIHIYGENLSPLRPQLITLLFVSCDIVAMSLQAVGGALTSSANTQVLADQGVDIMIAGLTFQVATTLAFCTVCAALYLRIRRNPSQINMDNDMVGFRKTRAFRVFLVTITIATITILIRCCYRLAELSQGYNSKLANDEVSFMVLEGAMMIICVGALTIGHPGPILGALWGVGKFRFANVLRKRMDHGDDGSGSDAGGPAIETRGKSNMSDSSGDESEKTLAVDQGLDHGLSKHQDDSGDVV